MPEIAYFLGVSITMFHRDHAPPHFHAYYGGHAASVDTRSGDVVRGRLPRRVARMVKRWTALRRDALMANWARAREKQELEKIAGPDDDPDGDEG